MTLAAATTIEVRTTLGSDSNGGGFVTGAAGTDYSQQNSAQYAATDLVIDGTTNTKVTSASHSFVGTDVGNLMQISAGISWTFGFYQIVSVSGGAATLDRSPGAVGLTGGTYAVGGALASITKATGITLVPGNTIYVKGVASYFETPTLGIVGTNALPITWIGYSNVRGDNGFVTIDGQNTRAACIVFNKNFNTIKNFILTGALTRAVDGTTAQLVATMINCQLLKGAGSASSGIGSSNFVAINARCILCIFNGFTTSSSGQTGTFIGCVFKNCAQLAIGASGGAFFVLKCIFAAGSGSGIVIGSSNNYIVIDSCLFYGKTSGSGIQFSGTNIGFTTVTNNLFISNSSYGLDDAAAEIGGIYANWNYYFGNTVGLRNGIPAGPNDVILTANPLNNPTAGDFSLNAVPGGGALVRGGNYPGAFLDGINVGNADGGPLQHPDPSTYFAY